jgi:ankyrin repeat protein
VKALLAAKPDIDVRDKKGRTADDHARERKREDIVEVIEAAQDR